MRLALMKKQSPILGCTCSKPNVPVVPGINNYRLSANRTSMAKQPHLRIIHSRMHKCRWTRMLNMSTALI